MSTGSESALLVMTLSVPVGLSGLVSFDSTRAAGVVHRFPRIVL